MIRAATKANRRRGGAPRRLPLSPLGARIDSLAAKRGIAMGALADAAGISRQSLGMIRTGRTSAPSADTAFAIARALGVSVDGLYSGIRAAPAKTSGRPRIIPLSPFGARLQRHMDRVGVGRVELAAQAGVNHVTLWRWMRGQARVPLDAATRLAKALGIAAADLLPGA